MYSPANLTIKLLTLQAGFCLIADALALLQVSDERFSACIFPNFTATITSALIPI